MPPQAALPAPANVAPVPMAPAGRATEVAPAPGWVVLYVFVCFVLSALGGAILVWWRMHGLW